MLAELSVNLLNHNTHVEYAIVTNKREESQLSLPARTCNKLVHQFL
jgi:hypothetical protein